MTALFDRLREWGWPRWAFVLIVALYIGLIVLIAPVCILIVAVVMLFLPLLRGFAAFVMIGSSVFFLGSLYRYNWSGAGTSLLVLIVSVILGCFVEYMGYTTGFAGPSDPYPWWYRKDRSPR